MSLIKKQDYKGLGEASGTDLTYFIISPMLSLTMKPNSSCVTLITAPLFVKFSCIPLEPRHFLKLHSISWTLRWFQRASEYPVWYFKSFEAKGTAKSPFLPAVLASWFCLYSILSYIPKIVIWKHGQFYSEEFSEFLQVKFMFISFWFILGQTSSSNY